MEGNFTGLLIFGIIIIGFFIMKKFVFGMWDEEIKCQKKKQ